MDRKRKLWWLLVIILGSVFCVGTSASAMTFEQLGEQLYNDAKLSLRKNQSCRTCHAKWAGLADPRNKNNPVTLPVSESSATRTIQDDTQVHMRIFGGRNAPSAAYAAYSPVMYYDDAEGLVIGGVFWDVRATGWTLVSPLAEQALGPFLNPVEMGMPLKAAVINDSGVCTDGEIAAALDSDPTCAGVCAGGNVDDIYDCIGLAIAAYEKTEDGATVVEAINKFSSAFDDWLAANPSIDPSTFGTDAAGNYVGPGAPGTAYVTLTDFDGLKAKGLALFNVVDKVNCAACHLTSNDPIAGKPDFTDFTYDNLGIPVNPVIDGLLEEPPPIDYGLGAQEDILNTLGAPIADQLGKFKVSSLRNVKRTPPYGHNGFFPTLESIVHFYNTRDDWPCGSGRPGVTPAELAAGNCKIFHIQNLSRRGSS